MNKEYLEGGTVATSHGVRGALKINHLCDSAEVLASQKRIFLKRKDGSFEERKVLSASVSGAQVIMTLEGISSREDAIAERGRIIYLHRSDIPLAEGAMFIADMIGLPVFDARSGAPLGEIADVSDAAGRRIYTIQTEHGEVLLPAVDEFIKEIGKGGMLVTPIPGFFDDQYEV